MFVRLSAISALCLACSGPGATDDTGDAEASASGRYGLVVLSHTYGEPGVAVSGQFMAYEGFTRDAALHAMAPAEDVWLLDDAPLAGECRALSVTGTSDGAIDLLGAGTLTVRPPEPLTATVELPARALPALVFSVSGMVYDADAPEDLPFLAGGTYRVTAPGAELGELFAEVDAPDGVRLTRLGGDAEHGLTVAWSGDPRALVTVSRDVGASTVGVLCAGDDGRAQIPPAELAILGTGAVQVAVAKAQRASTTIVGLDEADVLFVSRDTVELRLTGR